MGRSARCSFYFGRLMISLPVKLAGVSLNLLLYFTEFVIDDLRRVEGELYDRWIAELNRSDLSKLLSICLEKPDSFQNKGHEYAPFSLTYESRTVVVILAILVDTIASCEVLETTLGRIESYRSGCIGLSVHCWANGEISLAMLITEGHIGHVAGVRDYGKH